MNGAPRASMATIDEEELSELLTPDMVVYPQRFHILAQAAGAPLHENLGLSSEQRLVLYACSIARGAESL